MIPTVAVADSGLLISRLGFGCARIVGGSEMAATRRLIETALECGIRHFDTAPSYGGGQSEAVLGDILAGVAGVTIATKLGIPRPAQAGAMPLRQRLYRRFMRPVLAAAPGLKRALIAVASSRPRPGESPAPRHVLTAGMAQRSLDESERLLRRRPDIVLLHEPGQLDLDDDVLVLFETWRRQGRIAAYGTGSGVAVPIAMQAGSVVQQRYDPDAEVAVAPSHTALFHGVLASRTGIAVDQRVRDAMSRYPEAAMVFSASVPAQIRAVCRAFEAAI